MADPCFVYVMSCDGRTKIGISGNPMKRKVQLRAQSGLDVVLRSYREFHDRDVASKVERQLHSKFGRHRGYGEWFAVDAHKVAMELQALTPPEPAPERPRGYL